MPWQQGRSERDRRKPSNWQAIRTAVLERDNHICTIAGPRCTSRASHVDHIGGHHDHRLEALRAACQTCHMGRTARQAHAARREGSSRLPVEPHPNQRRTRASRGGGCP